MCQVKLRDAACVKNGWPVVILNLGLEIALFGAKKHLSLAADICLVSRLEW